MMISPRIVNKVTDAGLVTTDKSDDIREVRVCSKRTSNKIKKLTAAVFTEGSAKRVRSNVVAMAGKTGTAQIATKGEYQKAKKYNASFIGHFPADKPVYSMYVMVNQPSNGQFYASSVAAPVFSEIAQKIFTISVKQEVNNERENAPKYANGYYSDFQVLNQKLGVEIAQEVNVEVVSLDLENKTANPIAVADGKMPNVVGLGVKDAIYLLELKGLKPRVNGVGIVKEQSPLPGVKVQQNRTVYIRLQ
jgi:cell division protein FtsI (penicillin-binding protein 3)